MGSQTIFAFVIFLFASALLLLRIKIIHKDEERLDKSSISTIFLIIFSVTITNFRPMFIDIFAIFLFWSAANMIALWTGSYNDLQIYGKPPPSSKKIQPIRTLPKQLGSQHSTAITSPNISRSHASSVEISNLGEYTIIKNTSNVVRSKEFSVKVSKLTNFDLLKTTMIPDLDEVLLLGLALLLNWIIITPLTNLWLFNPYMMIYWGGIGIFLYTIRYSYTGPWLFAARMKNIEKKLMQGNVVVDFKFIGFVWSFALIILGSILAV